jgi:hypothetical protein
VSQKIQVIAFKTFYNRLVKNFYDVAITEGHWRVRHRQYALPGAVFILLQFGQNRQKTTNILQSAQMII